MSFNKGFNGGFDFTFLKLGNDNTSDTQWVANLDGATKYWQFSEPISLIAGDVVEFEFFGFEDSGAYKRFFGSTDFVLGLDTGASGSEFRLNRIEYAKIDSESIGNGTTIPDSGKLVCSIDESRDINTLGSLGSTRSIRAAMYNFKVIRNGTVIHELRLTNKTQGATQLATVGNVNATMINYTGDEWEVVEGEPVINDVARLDGATKYWQLSEPITIPANVDYEIGFYASRDLNDTGLLYIFGYSEGNIQAQHRLALSSGSPQRAYGMGFVAKDFNFDGDGQFTLAHSGTSKVTYIEFNTYADAFNDETITIDRLMGPWLGTDGGYLDGYVRDFYVQVDGVEILRIPLTNKSQGATQLATVGNINATMINYTGDEWEKPQ